MNRIPPTAEPWEPSLGPSSNATSAIPWSCTFAIWTCGPKWEPGQFAFQFPLLGRSAYQFPPLSPSPSRNVRTAYIHTDLSLSRPRTGPTHFLRRTPPSRSLPLKPPRGRVFLASRARSRKEIVSPLEEPLSIAGTRSDGRPRRGSGSITTPPFAMRTTYNPAPSGLSSSTPLPTLSRKSTFEPAIHRTQAGSTQTSFLAAHPMARRSRLSVFRFPSKLTFCLLTSKGCHRLSQWR